MTLNKNKSWYLVSSKPNQDEKAEHNLLNQGYDVYRPMAKRLRKYKGKMVQRTESLFPRYLFISLDTINDNWAPIRSTFGVASIIRFGMEPAKVPTELVNELKAKEEGLSEKAIDLDRFKNGDSIIIEQGAFKGLQAVFDCYDSGEQRSLVLIEMMGKLTKLPIDTVDVVRV